jgi:hypothetical protein
MDYNGISDVPSLFKVVQTTRAHRDSFLEANSGGMR